MSPEEGDERPDGGEDGDDEEDPEGDVSGIELIQGPRVRGDDLQYIIRSELILVYIAVDEVSLRLVSYEFVRRKRLGFVPACPGSGSG